MKGKFRKNVLKATVISLSEKQADGFNLLPPSPTALSAFFLNRKVLSTSDYHMLEILPSESPAQAFLLRTSHVLGGMNSRIFSEAVMDSVNFGTTWKSQRQIRLPHRAVHPCVNSTLF